MERDSLACAGSFRSFTNLLTGASLPVVVEWVTELLP